jgi:eukaryotic-like serine/threonine-protein kinase
LPSRPTERILLFREGDNDKAEAWLLPYPPGSGAPRRIWQKLPALRETPTFSWMPDSRHLVLSLTTDPNSPAHLSFADSESDDLTPITTGTAMEERPRVAPDGRSLLYTQQTSNQDIVSLSVEDGTARTMTSTGGQNNEAAWSANQAKLAWVTNRSGPVEIWIRLPDGTARAAVTASDFPVGTTKRLMDPTLSPDGDRLIYSRIDHAGVMRLWISSLSGGSPIRLTNAESGSEYGGTWSPDGSHFVYLQANGGKGSLMIVRPTGGAKSILLRENVWGYISDWSRAGDWITYRDDNGGWNLISPDGKTSKFLGKIHTEALAFSREGKLLYGIQTGETEADRDRVVLFSLDPVTLKQKVIKELGKDLRPDANSDQDTRFSLAPDGKSFVYTTVKDHSDIWMLQGYRQPGWFGRFSSALER